MKRLEGVRPCGAGSGRGIRPLDKKHRPGPGPVSIHGPATPPERDTEPGRTLDAHLHYLRALTREYFKGRKNDDILWEIVKGVDDAFTKAGCKEAR